MGRGRVASTLDEMSLCKPLVAQAVKSIYFSLEILNLTSPSANITCIKKEKKTKTNEFSKHTPLLFTRVYELGLFCDFDDQAQYIWPVHVG